MHSEDISARNKHSENAKRLVLFINAFWTFAYALFGSFYVFCTFF